MAYTCHSFHNKFSWTLGSVVTINPSDQWFDIHYRALSGVLLFLQDKKVTGRKADAILAAHLASEAALRLVKPANDVRTIFRIRFLSL